MPKFVIRSSVAAVHSRVIYIDSSSADQAAEDFVKNTLNNIYDGMPAHIEFDQDSAVFEIDLADANDPRQLNLGLFH